MEYYYVVFGLLSNQEGLHILFGCNGIKVDYYLADAVVRYYH